MPRALGVGATTYDLSDRLGTSTLQTSAAKATTAARAYDAFGLLVASTGVPLEEEQVRVPKKRQVREVNMSGPENRKRGDPLRKSERRIVPADPVNDPDAPRIVVSGVRFRSAFKDVSDREPGWRLNMLTDAALALEASPKDADLRGYLRLCARAGTLDPDVVVRSNAYAALAELHEPMDRPWLVHGLNDKDEDIRCLSLEGLGWIGYRRDAHLIVGSLKDRSEKVRCGAILALVSTDRGNAFEPIRQHLEHERGSKARSVAYFVIMSRPSKSDLNPDHFENRLKSEKLLVRRRVDELLKGGDVAEFINSCEPKSAGAEP